MNIADFKELVWAQSNKLYRDMPWRAAPSFYNVLVSEMMLQQTQVGRVRIKFVEFMNRFPSLESLANASLGDVLRAWSGLGYSRRAKYLWQAARQIVDHGAPHTIDELVRLPGVGKNTAGAIMNYVYEVPTPFVETNIRTVYLYHFFDNEIDVTDHDIYELVQATIDIEHPRQWFWALMDYGTYLKREHGARLNQTRSYKKQPPLKGSVREIRGQILRALHETELSPEALHQVVTVDERFTRALDGLQSDGLIASTNGMYHLAK